MIEARGVSKSFESNQVLKDIHAVFETGMTNLIIGQSGSGKTVLLKILAGLLYPDRGEVLFEGKDVISMGIKEHRMLQRQIGMLFQNAALFDSQNVLDNVLFPLNMFSQMSHRGDGMPGTRAAARCYTFDALRPKRRDAKARRDSARHCAQSEVPLLR